MKVAVSCPWSKNVEPRLWTGTTKADAMGHGQPPLNSDWVETHSNGASKSEWGADVHKLFHLLNLADLVTAARLWSLLYDAIRYL